MEKEIYSMKEIGQIVSAYFKDNRLSQEEVAKILGYSSKQVIANQLNGKRFGKLTAKKYAKAFGFNEMFLLTGKGNLFSSTSLDTNRLEEENMKLLKIIESQQETIKSLLG